VSFGTDRTDSYIIINNITYFSCCTTCEDVLDAYRVRKWNMQVDKIEQCKGKYKRTDEDAFKEGCRIQGHLEVNRVSRKKSLSNF